MIYSAKGDYWAEIVSLPACISEGKRMDEVLTMAK
ncbi:hypothetical protein NIES4101_89580 [Calothrix sp. NIES-4101]|nr:hypothetical protein NIES4101_89580 [Calothrix sp. NIES-4101]